MRPRKKDSSLPVLILQPFPVLREMELFVFFLLGQGTRKHQVPHAFLLFKASSSDQALQF